MIIHFSTNYDGEVFLNSRTDLMGVSYLGPQGLLQQLELRAGLHTEVKSDVEREADYLNAMAPHMEGTMFQRAFNVDKIGVAGKLLGWRDNLLMAGWDGKCTDKAATKLCVLADIEKKFSSPGTADAWVKVCKQYASHDILSDRVEESVIECPWSEIPYLIQKTLMSIRQFGTKVTDVVPETTEQVSLDTSKVKVLEFEDVNDIVKAVEAKL